MAEITRDFFVRTGRKGGQALVNKRGRPYMTKLAKKAAKARWANHKKSVKS